MKQLIENIFKLLTIGLAFQASLPAAAKEKSAKQTADESHAKASASHADFLDRLMAGETIQYTYDLETGHRIETTEKKPESLATNDDPELHRLISKVGIVYTDDYHDTGISHERYEKVFWQMVKKIRDNLPYAANTEVLKKVLRQSKQDPKDPGHCILITSPSLMKNMRGAYDFETDRIRIVWDPDMTDTELRQILQNEYSHASMCAARRTEVGNNSACTLHPTPMALHKTILDGFDKIETYRKNFFKYLDKKQLNKKTQPSKKLDTFLKEVASYEPFEGHLKVSTKAHQNILKSSGVEKRSDGRIYIPKDTMINGKPIQEECLSRPIKVDKDTMDYRITWAVGDTLEAKAKAFFIDMAQSYGRYRSGYNAFFQTSEAHKVAEMASDIEMLTSNLKHFFFQKFCSMLSDFHSVDDYCERPTVKV